MAREHVIDPKVVHHQWDAGLEPLLAIESGDTVHFDIMVAGEGQVWPGATYADTRFDFDTIYNLSGPVWVNGAEPGDTLQVDVLDLRHGDWGWAAFLPGLGLLPDDFPHGYVRTFQLREGTAGFAPGISIPLVPFCGTIGNHPGEPRKMVPFPPHRGCGNIDNRHLTSGSTLWVPVHLPGAMFSCGDPHAAQGDGEVSVTALEAPLSGSLRFTLHKQAISAPRFRVPARSKAIREGGYQATMGISPDLMDGSRIAVRAMIEWLNDACGLSADDAYLLCSIMGDLKIIEVVDSGVWTVAMTMPLDVFNGGG
ncbi:MAG TPA: acetamidase/formamidase family protein [Streptosporangiaceae bacterium]|nr:acetamidase/formamidase family protein [Streptosporangiaceae bacterium]